MSESYDWTGAAQGGPQAEKIPAGKRIPVTIHKIVYAKKGGKTFASKGGDPQIMLVFRDEKDREAAQMFTLSKKAAWTLSRLMSRFGLDTDTLKAEGIQPEQFAIPTFADAKLIGLRGLVDVKYVDGYSEVEPSDELDVAVNSTGPTEYTEIKEEDIPF